MSELTADVVIVGGGPGGLGAALALPAIEPSPKHKPAP